MTTFRRIAAASVLFAVMAMGVAAPAASAAGQGDATAASAGLDTALVAGPARRLRQRDNGPGRDSGPDIDGRAGGRGRTLLGLFHPLWLTAAAPFQAPVLVEVTFSPGAPSRAPAMPFLAPRTSRGPPSRS
jgi:hypothetical protein